MTHWIKVMTLRRMRNLQTIDKLDAGRKKGKTFYVKDLKQHVLADFTDLHATNNLYPILNCIHVARAGFSLKILGFALCETLHFILYSPYERRFLNGEFPSPLGLLLLHVSIIGMVNICLTCSV